MKKVYKCEKCNTEFESDIDCAEHELKCLNTEEIVNKNLYEALELLVKKYGLGVNSVKVKCYILECDCALASQQIEIYLECNLPNGNTFNTNHQSFWGCDLAKTEEIYNRIESFITPLLDTKYEGVIHKNPDLEDYFDPYFVGDMSLQEIAARLFGRKIKIEVINESNGRQEAEEIIDKYLEEIDTCDCPSCTCDHGNC